MPRFSIVVPAFNASESIGRSIEMLQQQTFGDFELIIVDDGSTDGTFSAAQSFAAGDERIRCLRQQNAGAASARNNGMRYAQGEYILFLDSDDLYKPSLLECLHG